MVDPIDNLHRQKQRQLGQRAYRRPFAPDAASRSSTPMARTRVGGRLAEYHASLDPVPNEMFAPRAEGAPKPYEMASSRLVLPEALGPLISVKWGSGFNSTDCKQRKSVTCSRLKLTAYSLIGITT